MNAETTAEVLICERATHIEEHGPATFITAVLPASSGGLLRCESHVFIDAGEQHLHEITFLAVDAEDLAQVLREANVRTHQLFADQHTHRTPQAPATLTYHLHPLAHLPFATWRAAGLFTRALAALPDLTASSHLTTAVQAHLRSSSPPTRPAPRPRFDP